MWKKFKKKFKGFTLIELLAVIVILAIIALIAVPIILNVVNDTKKSANERSAEFYLDAVNNAIARQNLKEPLTNGIFEVQSDGNLFYDGITIEIDMDGEKASSGVILLKDGKIERVLNLKVGDSIYNKGSDGKLVLIDTSKACIRQEDIYGFDTVTCGTESFYVISENNDTITMLAKNILNIGYATKLTWEPGLCWTEEDKQGNFYTLCREGQTVHELVPIENPTGIQVSNSSFKLYGTIQFDDNVSDNPTECTATIVNNYNSETLIYNYVENYKKYLVNNNVAVKEARLLTYNEAIELGCNGEYCAPEIFNFDEENNSTGANAPSWVYSTSYWLGDGLTDCDYQYVIDKEMIRRVKKDNKSSYGLRPVIVISKESTN